MKNKLFYFVAAVLLVSGCQNIQKQNIQELIIEQAVNCKSLNCTIVISHLTNFNWDKMYVFNNATGPDEISHVIGINYPYYQEFSKSIVLLYKNKIVHYENNEDNIEAPTDGSVIFDYPDSLKYQVYTPTEAKFKVKKVTFNTGVYNGAYYKLYQ